MKKETKKKEPSYEKFYPSASCPWCEGRGEVKDDYRVGFLSSSYWTYKKCTNCNGSGKNIWGCLWCKSPIIGLSLGGFWCPNQNCEKYALHVNLANRED